MQLSQYKAFGNVSAILTLAEAIKIYESARIENSSTINLFQINTRRGILIAWEAPQENPTAWVI
jgi:hypothetical protein